MARVGITSEILDGKLNPRVSLPEDVVLVVGRATSGPTNRLYNVSDTETAKTIFGASSPVIQLMRHAYAGGANNVAIYRIGGRSASIDNLFGEYTTVRTQDASARAGTNLSLYAGPRVNDPTSSVIVVYDGNKVVYSNAPGMEVDTGQVALDGFDSKAFPFYIGNLGAPVAFKDVPNNLKIRETVTLESAGTKTLTLPKQGTVVQVVKSTGTSVETITDYTVSGTTLTLGVQPTVGTLFQVTTASDVAASTYGIVYTPGEDNMGASLNKLYELYDTAFVELEAFEVVSIATEDLFAANNKADPTHDPKANALSFVQRTEDGDGFTYKWSDSKFIYQSLADPTKTTTVLDQAALDSNGLPVVVEQYNEVDFAHRLAMWAWKQSDTAHYVNGVIGPRIPGSTHTLAIKRWIGTAPTKDIYGSIITNGSGLLGNKYMVGTTKQAAGFYATDTGYPDGDALYDSSGVIVDIGKHLSVPILPVYMAADLYTSSGAVARSAAAAYAGLLTQVTAGDSTTNIVLPGVTPVFKLKANTVQALSEAGYVVCEEKPKGLTVYSGDLASAPNSDFKYVSTAIALTQVLKGLRSVTDPYVGKGISAAMMTALYNAVDIELKGAISAGYINGFSFNIVGTDANSLKIPLVIQPKHELRHVKISVSLSEQDLISL